MLHKIFHVFNFRRKRSLTKILMTKNLWSMICFRFIFFFCLPIAEFLLSASPVVLWWLMSMYQHSVKQCCVHIRIRVRIHVWLFYLPFFSWKEILELVYTSVKAMNDFCPSFTLSFLFLWLIQDYLILQSSLNINQFHVIRSSAVDTIK